MNHAHPPAVIRKAHAGPRAVAKTTLIIAGKSIGTDGVTYTYTGTITLVPSGVTPAPVPVPTPTPTPSPNPTPNPNPAPDVTVWGFRNAKRDWSTSFSPGQTILIEGANFGAAVGTVSVNHNGVPTLRWTDTEIEITCPQPATGAKAGAVPLDIMRADKKSWSATQGFTLVPTAVGARGKVEF